MAIVGITQQNIEVSMQNDAQYLRTFLSWVNERYQSYSQNMTTANMTAATISPGDQAAILAFIGDLNRLKTLASGVVPADATDMHFDCAAILGIV